MLILTRGSKERTVLTTKSPQRIVVEVLSIQGDTVHLGFTADRDQVEIYRQEIQDTIDAKKINQK